MHSFGVKHVLNFRAPDGFTAIGNFLNGPVQRVKRTGTMVLRPVKLDSARNPGTCQPDQGRFDHPIIIDEVVSVGFIQRHLHPAANFRQNHDFKITVFEIEGFIRFILFLI